jgi:hypothetical protein
MQQIIAELYFTCQISSKIKIWFSSNHTNSCSSLCFSLPFPISLYLSLGLIQEVDTEESTISDNCMKKYCELVHEKYPCDALKQMKSVLFSKRLARGPAHAHAFVESLYDQEDFCLQSDSHIGVVQVTDPPISLLAPRSLSLSLVHAQSFIELGC